MVPRHAINVEVAARFPRPRGDGPPVGLGALDLFTVPPPTRGWSPGGVRRARPVYGSPAHAGMVPLTQSDYNYNQGFPRPRGDGPPCRHRPPLRHRVPPPTRGWSRHAAAMRRSAEGSPAHAGMVPVSLATAGDGHRFPRPRGDGPQFCPGHVIAIRVPPPTRGWSLGLQLPGYMAHGSPAHAGMVLPGRPPPPIPPWFPRPRGDGPNCARQPPITRRVPPPTRGWSLFLVARMFGQRGSPAHAAMVPCAIPSRRVPQRFPRPRGDGPATAPTGVGRVTVPPPTRGWSHERHFALRHAVGSPAHAGMVPLLIPWLIFILRFPRPRGDGPAAITAGVTEFRVPPPTRGWSRACEIGGRDFAGSPAHAGMVPRPKHPRPCHCRFPRPRGDGPTGSRCAARSTGVPPPTRGWSPA